jgi:hypothetical protein
MYIDLVSHQKSSLSKFKERIFNMIIKVCEDIFRIMELNRFCINKSLILL